MVIDRLIPFKGILQSRDGIYSDKNLYCKWKGINSNMNSRIFLNLTIFELQEEKYYIEIIYLNGSSKTYDINSKFSCKVIHIIQNFILI